MIALKSRVAQKVLGLYFLHPQESFYVNELSRRLALDKRNLVKKLREYELAGLLMSEKRGNLRLYRINRQFPLYKEYEKIFFKTLGVEQKLKELLAAVPGVKEAYLYGSYAQAKLAAHSDLDLLVVGDHRIVSLQEKLTSLQSEIGREVNCVHMSESEFRRRKTEKDHFISRVLRGKTIRLV